MKGAILTEDDEPGRERAADADETAPPPELDRSPPAPLADSPDPPPEVPLRVHALAALGHRNFRLFYAGQFLSLVGTWMQSTAQGWLVLNLTDSSLLLGVVTAAASAPTVLFSLYAGALADRADKRAIIMRANAAALVLALLLAVLTSTGTITYPAVLAIAFALGTANAFEIPTRQSFFVELVGKDDLPNAIALNSAQFNATRIVGPAVAGWLIGTAGTAACFYVNAASYVFVLAGLRAMRLPGFRPPETRAGTIDNIREGLAYIRSDRLVRTLVSLIAAFSIFGFPYVMLMPVFARDILKVGAHGLGWLLAATGSGALAGGIALAAAGERVPRGRIMLGASLGLCVSVFAFAGSRSFPLSLALLAVVGFCVVLNNTSINALLQSTVPDRLRGRVMSVYVLMFIGTAPIGALQAGAVSRWLSAQAALQIGAALLAATVLAVAWKVPELVKSR
ncbi:MAG TPA: MFS transporter [Longimicrobium sp.]|nr:MFS transporter [Longimicrobium sp.]